MHVHLHKPNPQRAQSNVRKSTQIPRAPVIIPFVTPLPMNHPLNNNAPQSGLSPTIPINSATVAAVPLVPPAASPHVHGASPPHTPTPHTITPIPPSTDPSPAPAIRGKKGKN